MKKLLSIILMSVAMVSCYDDYLTDWAFNSVYFPNQLDVRSFVVGEGMSFEVGVQLGGVRENSVNRNVNFILDPALLTPAILNSMKTNSYNHIKTPTATVAALQLLPAGYYNLSDASKMVIKSGSHTGVIKVKADSSSFLSDPAATLVANYALPFKITTADTDSILPLKNYEIIGVKYENKLFGNYWHGGAAVVKRPGLADTNFVYKTQIPVPNNKVWTLTTTGPSQLTANGYLDVTTAKAEMTLTLSGTTVTVSSAAGSTYLVEADGASSFNNPKLLQNRKLYIKYKYTNSGNGYTYYCTDTLTFRNRIRDGVNEWQDENPSHY